jgi:hypothetical protein
MSQTINHPTLGTFQTEGWEWHLQRTVQFACVGFSSGAVYICVNNQFDVPSAEQYQQLVDLIALPQSFRVVVEKAIFSAYVTEIRAEYLEAINDRGFKCNFSSDEMQAVESSGDVLRFIIDLYCVWMHEDASVDMVFRTRLDIEHQLRVLLRGTRAERIWME